MDLFFESLAVENKKRIHFHRMLRDVHERMQALGNVEDPLDKVADDIARNTTVLCFDEFFVSDIGDAMILGRLLAALFERGVTLVATSNSHPDDLYKGGLQRQQFIPAIERLKEHTDIVHIGGGVDYRLRLLQQAGTYLTPNDDDARSRLQHFFDDSANDICDGPRSQNDYIEIARWYPTVIVSGIPKLGPDLENQARRLIALVDEFYDRRVKLILSAAAPVDALYAGEHLDFEFERTVSRLIEMQSTDYLAAPHLA
jgi:cell division protein ZapE